MMKDVAAFFADTNYNLHLASLFIAGFGLIRLWYADSFSRERDEARLRNAVIACGLILLAIYFKVPAR